MATGEIKYCDVNGTTHKVETYRVTLQRVDGDFQNRATVFPPAHVSGVDLCPSSVKRLIHFIKRGTRKPGANCDDKKPDPQGNLGLEIPDATECEKRIAKAV